MVWSIMILAFLMARSSLVSAKITEGGSFLFPRVSCQISLFFPSFFSATLNQTRIPAPRCCTLLRQRTETL
jgi:hypothetical protein